MEAHLNVKELYVNAFICHVFALYRMFDLGCLIPVIRVVNHNDHHVNEVNLGKVHLQTLRLSFFRDLMHNAVL